eukprot:gene6594-7287_t
MLITVLILRRCFLEVIFVSQYLWLAFVPNSLFWTDYYDDDDRTEDCRTNPNIWPLAWLTQFSLLGAELWFASLAVDIHVSLTNPFSSHQAYDHYYLVFVYGVAAMMATILVSITPIQYGVSTDPMIWVRDQTGTVNWMKIGMFYMFIPFLYLYAGVVLVWARWQIRRGLEETLKMRQYSVSKLSHYVLGYFCFYAVLYCIQFVTYLKEDFNAYDVSWSIEKGLRTFSAFLLASRGIWSLGIFVLSNALELQLYLKHLRGELPSSTADASRQVEVINAPKEEEELVQLNVALQKEIVRFTATGIRQALRAMERSSTIQAQRSSSGRTSTTSGGFIMLFQAKMPGDAHSFLVDDLDLPPSVSVDSDRSSVNSDIENPLRSSVASQLATSTAQQRSSLRPSLQPSFLPGEERPSYQHSPSVDQISYNMMPNSRNSILGGRSFSPSPKPEERNLSAASASSLSTRLFAGMRKLFTPHNSFEFTDFSPKRFENIRRLSGINSEDYTRSFSSTTMPDFSGGRSGAFVYFSWDYKYIVKTTTAKELETLLHLLPAYEIYLKGERARKRESLLTRYLGAHRIIMYDIPLYFVVMKNLCPGRVDEKFDLKGSWISRHGSKKKKQLVAAGARFKRGGEREEGSAPLFLDNDLQNRFLLHPKDSLRLAQQLRRDTAFLQRFNLMDYSLLVGVQRKLFHLDREQTKSEQQNDDDSVQAAAVEGPGTFHVGLIDMLQVWDWGKWVEHVTKVFLLRKDGAGISAVEPSYYRMRFMRRAVIDVFDGLDNFDLDGSELEESEEDAVAQQEGSESSAVSSSRSSLQIQSGSQQDDREV